MIFFIFLINFSNSFVPQSSGKYSLDINENEEINITLIGEKACIVFESLNNCIIKTYDYSIIKSYINILNQDQKHFGLHNSYHPIKISVKALKNITFSFHFLKYNIYCDLFYISNNPNEFFFMDNFPNSNLSSSKNQNICFWYINEFSTTIYSSSKMSPRDLGIQFFYGTDLISTLILSNTKKRKIDFYTDIFITFISSNEEFERSWSISFSSNQNNLNRFIYRTSFIPNSTNLILTNQLNSKDCVNNLQKSKIIIKKSNYNYLNYIIILIFLFIIILNEYFLKKKIKNNNEYEKFIPEIIL